MSAPRRQYRKLKRRTSCLSPKALFTAAPVALAVYDRTPRVLRMSDRQAELLGCEVSDLIGCDLRGIRPEMADKVLRDFDVFDSGGIVCDHQFERDGQIFHASVEPIRDGAGYVVAMTVALLDITEECRIDRELIRESGRLTD